MYYFIGIKGAGMSSLAVIMKGLGYKVCGSDLEKHFFTEEELIKNNISMYHSSIQDPIYSQILNPRLMLKL